MPQFRRSLRLAFLIAWPAVSLPGAPTFARNGELADRVIDLMDRRLALMPEVAAYKFRRHRPVADPGRERAVIEASVADAQALHLDPEAARAFFAAQIALAKTVENAWIARWTAAGTMPAPARDLARDIRPALDALDRELLPAVYLASPALTSLPEPELAGRLRRLLRQPGLTAASLAGICRALEALRITADPTWAVLQRTGTLRVGTTGDYAPFSEERGGFLQGVDIELAQALARSWGLKLEFVPTSWPTLMDDLRRRRFDLALSGITVTPERRRGADFSTPYYDDGKMAIARRENARRFSSLAAIDQPGVRVLENPGGTNERFAREHLRRASLVLYPDNRTIFAALAAGRGDVMITDEIEVRLQERRHPELQATLAEPLTRSAKAILLPRGSELTARVDRWLASGAATGRIASLRAGQLGPAAAKP
ncbi:MAG TPA: gamma subclass chorismate mutase AroQ [Opitutaceae bacterium]|nr:gamma subclass chorismate mutase AroQ [Opitutaceae bacterium]